jgi:anaerobic selenocysteine-containing dehydrogenase
MINRRAFLKLSALIGISAVSDLGLEKMLCAAEAPDFSPMGQGGQELEATIDLQTGSVKPNPDILMRHSSCLGCYSSCGSRVKIDKRTGQILGVTGNPFNPNNAEPHLEMDASLKEAYLAFSSYQDKGLRHRGALCANGQGTLQAHHDPFRILSPLKRAGKRGEGKWRPISWKQALQETVEGGLLFRDLGEDQLIEGLRQIHDFQTLIDKDQPEFGPKVNQLVFIGGRGDGRTPFAQRFTDAYGTVNYYGHAVT